MDDRQLSENEIKKLRVLADELNVFYADCIVEIEHHVGENAAEYLREILRDGTSDRTLDKTEEASVFKHAICFHGIGHPQLAYLGQPERPYRTKATA